jgi:hypothetical protein
MNEIARDSKPKRSIGTWGALALLIGWMDWFQVFGAGRSIDGTVFAIEGACMFLGVGLAFTLGQVARQRNACEAIFTQVLEATTDSHAAAP